MAKKEQLNEIERFYLIICDEKLITVAVCEVFSHLASGFTYNT